VGARAAVQVGTRSIETRVLPIPEVGPGEALLRVEACGMCFSDVEFYLGHDGGGLMKYPFIPGHEFVGRIESISDGAARSMGVTAGTRVAVEPNLACGSCIACVRGRRNVCPNRIYYGLTPTSAGSGLWGGYAEYVLLQPGTIVHPLPEHISAVDGVMFNPLGSGFDWAVRAGGVTVGDNVVVIGPGQRGLACVIAAAEAGAARVIVAGRSRRLPWRFDLAREYGATDIVDTDREDLATRVREITDGRMADVVVETSSNSLQPIVDAVMAVRPEGTVVLAGAKNADTVPGLSPDLITRKAITIKGVTTVSNWAMEQAIRVVGSGRYSFEQYHTHTFKLDQYDHAVRLLAGEIEGENALHITVVP
jgi:threonine dehydrogenase-like Zn-dependent dehydrogenase